MDYADKQARASAGRRAAVSGRKQRAAGGSRWDVRRGLAALLFALRVSVLATVPAYAAGTARSPHSEERLYSQGNAALQAKDYAAATQAYSELYRLTRRPEALYQLGIIAQAQGRLLEAQDLLRRFLSDPRFDPSSSAPLEVEAQRILALPRPPSSKVNIIGSSGTLVTLDQRVVGSLPLARPLLVTPGKHVLLLEGGVRRQQEEIEVALGRFVEITYDRSSQALLITELPGVLLVDAYAGLPEATAQKLEQTVEDLIQRERLSPFPIALAMERPGTETLRGCVQTPACQLQLAQKYDLEYILSVRISQQTAGATWELKLDLQDVEIENSAAMTQKQCPMCELAKATEFLTNALPPLFARARQRPRSELQVRSTPPGAEVFIGERRLGITPLSHPVWAGPLELELRLNGYESQRLPVTAAEGKQENLTITLQQEVNEPPPAALVVPVVPPAPPPPAPPVVPAPPPEKPRPARPRWRLALGGIAIGVGVVLAGFGGSALSVADTCLPGTPPTAAVCRQFYGTTGIGGGLLAGGLVSGAAGILLLAIPDRPRSTTKSAPTAPAPPPPALATPAAATAASF